jgi:hypothetical protein
MLSLRAAQYDPTSIFNQRTGVSRHISALLAAQSCNIPNVRLAVNPSARESSRPVHPRAACCGTAIHYSLPTHPYPCTEPVPAGASEAEMRPEGIEPSTLGLRVPCSAS